MKKIFVFSAFSLLVTLSAFADQGRMSCGYEPRESEEHERREHRRRSREMRGEEARETKAMEAKEEAEVAETEGDDY